MKLAAVLVVALVSAVLIGGRYQAIGGNQGSAFVVDRLTATVWWCTGQCSRMQYANSN